MGNRSVDYSEVRSVITAVWSRGWFDTARAVGDKGRAILRTMYGQREEERCAAQKTRKVSYF